MIISTAVLRSSGQVIMLNFCQRLAP